MSSLRDSRQPIATKWAGWIRSRRAALRELVAAACDEVFSVANSHDPRQARASAPSFLERIGTSYLTSNAACGALISAQPAAAHAGHGLPASPVDPDLLAGLAMHRVAFSQSRSAALGTGQSALAHPSTV